MATYTVHTSGRRFRSKIRGKRTCTPPKTNIRGKLQSYKRGGRHKVHQNHGRLGLETKTSASVPARLHQQSTKTVQPYKKENQNQLYPNAPIIYAAKKQYVTQPSTAPLLDKKGKKFIQKVCGNFLFLGRAVDSTLLCPISAIV